MKATVGLLLLLLTVNCWAVGPEALNEMAPGECCFKFFTGRIPVNNIVSVTKTHSDCLEKAFVVHTAKRRLYCVGHTVTWAQDAFNKEQNTEGVDEMAPAECCFRVTTRRIPVKNIVSVTKTHSGCLEKAFVVHTAKRRRYCVGHTVTWAQDAFNKEQNSD